MSESDTPQTPMLRLSRPVAGVAFLALMGMIGVTLADIVLRIVSRLPGRPLAGLMPPAVPGVVDLVQLTLVAVAHLSIAAAFMVGAHVTVDVIATRFPSGVRNVLRRFCWVLSFGFMTICFIEALRQALAQWRDGLVSATINLPLWWYWIAVVVGTAIAALACFVHIFGRMHPGRGH